MEFLRRYRHIILYLLMGVYTTLVNVISYWVFNHVLRLTIMVSTIAAWILAVLFAYVTNRKWVFQSSADTRQKIVHEVISFFTCRLATGVIDWIFMFIFVECLKFNDVIMKFLANFIVIILNYIASKKIIFK